MSTIPHSVALPQSVASGFDAEATRDFLVRAEEAGFEAVWTMEQVVGPTPMLAPLELLSWAAGCTERIRLGVAVLVTALHQPIQLASQVVAVDQLSHGRLELGISAGGGFRPFEAFGVDRDTFVSRFTDGLDLMRAIWAQDRVTVDSRFWKVDDLPFAPRPVQRPHPPIWFGASAPRSLARAVRLGDAFQGAGSTPTAKFAEQASVVRSELERQDKDPASFRIGKRVYLEVDDDAERARDRALSGLHRIYGDMPGIEDVPVTGTVDDVVRGLCEVLDAGAQTILLNPLGESVADHREQLERLVSDVVPRLPT